MDVKKACSDFNLDNIIHIVLRSNIEFRDFFESHLFLIRTRISCSIFIRLTLVCYLFIRQSLIFCMYCTKYIVLYVLSVEIRTLGICTLGPESVVRNPYKDVSFENSSWAVQQYLVCYPYNDFSFAILMMISHSQSMLCDDLSFAICMAITL